MTTDTATATTFEALEESLEQALDTHADEPAGFIVNDLESATWAARKRAQAQSKADEVSAVAKAQRDRIDEWERDASKAHLERVEFFDGLLTFYHQSVLRAEEAEGTPDKHLTKSVKLPGVSLTSRSLPAEWKVDDDAFVPWATKHRPDLIETTTKVKLAEVKKALTPSKDGTAVDASVDAKVPVPGVTVADKPRAFAVKPT